MLKLSVQEKVVAEPPLLPAVWGRRSLWRLVEHESCPTQRNIYWAHGFSYWYACLFLVFFWVSWTWWQLRGRGISKGRSPWESRTLDARMEILYFTRIWLCVRRRRDPSIYEFLYKFGLNVGKGCKTQYKNCVLQGCAAVERSLCIANFVFLYFHM